MLYYLPLTPLVNQNEEAFTTINSMFFLSWLIFVFIQTARGGSCRCEWIELFLLKSRLQTGNQTNSKLRRNVHSRHQYEDDRMTRSVVLLILSLSVFVSVKCRNQESYLNQAVNPYADRAESNATESSLKLTRKYTLFKSVSTTSVWEVYTPTTSTDGQYEIARGASATPEYSNQFGKKTTADELATVAGPSSSTISPQEPSKFAVPYPEQNTPFSETVYRDKICKNEPTCHMAKLAPEELTHLGTRNCMCDEDCRKYGDCCLDSPYYNATEQRLHYQAFYCSAQELVYMKTKCPDYYSITDIKVKCEISSQPLASDDTKLATPVTNFESRITYGNEFCAQCHNDYDYHSWNFTYYCSEDVFINPLEIVEDKDESSASANPSVPVRDYLWETNEAAKHVEYDPATKTFRSTFNNRKYTCSYYRFVSEDIRQQIRMCIPSIAECSSTADQALADKCISYTGIVYHKNVVYKNEDCAVCNGNQKINALSGCKIKDF